MLGNGCKQMICKVMALLASGVSYLSIREIAIVVGEVGKLHLQVLVALKGREPVLAHLP